MRSRAPGIGGDYLVTSDNGIPVRRIRTPHDHDVLCGRGGGINSHVGNRVFRDWVAERRLDYNLATSKAEKARVAKEVMSLVTKQNPPGRFLQRDPTGGIGSWWIEIDETKAMAKTSQALREGAPSIRAQHQHDAPTTNRRSGTSTIRKREQSSPVTTYISSPLMSNAQFDTEFRPTKMIKIATTTVDEPQGPKSVTPTLVPATSAEMSVPSFNLAETPAVVTIPPTTAHEVRDVALKEGPIDWSKHGALGDFVNPFENEEERYEKLFLSQSNDLEPGLGFHNQSYTTYLPEDVCAQCGKHVMHGKECSCMAQFDPLNQIAHIVQI